MDLRHFGECLSPRIRQPHLHGTPVAFDRNPDHEVVLHERACAVLDASDPRHALAAARLAAAHG